MMRNQVQFAVWVLTGLTWLGCSAELQSQLVRFATFNTSLNACLDNIGSPCLAGGLSQRLADAAFEQGQQLAETIQRVRPDVILLNEFNYDATGRAGELFQQNFLSVPQHWSGHPAGPAEAIEYPYRFSAPSNTGIHSGMDLNNDGVIDPAVGSRAYGDDSYGFGEFPGRYGMLVLSRYPIAETEIRTFQNFLWRDMPGAMLPDDPRTAAPSDWYSADELELFRLSSKSHWDVPIRVGSQTIHLLASHPTPPVFDGAEDRNGRRNHDEIRLWADYLETDSSGYIVDDAGRAGGLTSNDSFVIVGDLNADPTRGDGIPGAINQLLEHPRVNASQVPISSSGDITSDFDLRVDYVLPSVDLISEDTGVFYPALGDPLRRLTRASDHRLVWLDIRVVPEPGGNAQIVWLLPTIPYLVRRQRTRCGPAEWQRKRSPAPS